MLSLKIGDDNKLISTTTWGGIYLPGPTKYQETVLCRFSYHAGKVAGEGAYGGDRLVL